jgi:hypothetical protein
MSTTFAVILKNGEQHDVARRVGRGILGCELSFTNEMVELMSDEIPVIPTDNSAQGIYTIGDIREHIRKQEAAERETEKEDLEDRSWIDDSSKIEQYQRKSVFVPMTDAWHKEHDFIEITEWKNGEGWDIEISASEGIRHVSLHFTEFAIIKQLLALLEKN